MAGASSNTAKNAALGWVLCLAFLAFCEWFFFRNVMGTDALIGDSGDGRLTTLIAEHWFHVATGTAALTDLGIFYPAPDTLGYSDMLLGLGGVHTMFRLFGFDMYTAYKATLISVHAFGTVTMFYLLKRSFKAGYGWALFGTVAFSFSNAYAIHICHTQLVALSMMPFAAIMIAGFCRNVRRRLARNVYAAATIAWVVLLVYTAWYIAFFTAVFTALAVVIALCFFAVNDRGSLLNLLAVMRSMWVDLVWYAALLVALLIPFALLELPIMRMSGKRSYAEVALYLPELIDIINATPQNMLLSPLMTALNLEARGLGMEVTGGFSPVLLIVFAVSLALFARRLGNRRGQSGFVACELLVVLSIAVIAGILLVLKLNSDGLSLWWLVYRFAPGGGSIRAVARFFLYLSFPMAIAASCMADALWRSSTLSRAGVKASLVGLIAIVAFAFVANVHIGGVVSGWNKAERVSFVESVATPPDDCEAFYVVNATSDLEALASLDAHELSDYLGIPTVNGYSGLEPVGLRGVGAVDSDDYEEIIGNWAASNHLQNVYAYDEGRDEWARMENRRGEGA